MGKEKVVLTASDVWHYKYCPVKWEKEKRVEIVLLYRKGYSIEEIASSTGFDEKYIKKVLKEYKYL